MGKGRECPWSLWHMQSWPLGPASQRALSTAHGSFLKVLATRQEGCLQERPQSSWRLVGPEGFMSFWAMSQQSIIVTPTQ